MKRQTLSRATATALLGVAVLMGGGKSYASDADGVKATINEFHAALTALDLAKMDAIWVHDDRVMDKEPLAKGATLGWEGVVRLTALADAKRDTPARKRRSMPQARATPSMRSSVSACKPAG
jgi:hypothetical protein